MALKYGVETRSAGGWLACGYSASRIRRLVVGQLMETLSGIPRSVLMSNEIRKDKEPGNEDVAICWKFINKRKIKEILDLSCFLFVFIN